MIPSFDRRGWAPSAARKWRVQRREPVVEIWQQNVEGQCSPLPQRHLGFVRHAVGDLLRRSRLDVPPTMTYPSIRIIGYVVELANYVEALSLLGDENRLRLCALLAEREL